MRIRQENKQKKKIAQKALVTMDTKQLDQNKRNTEIIETERKTAKVVSSDNVKMQAGIEMLK